MPCTLVFFGVGAASWGSPRDGTPVLTCRLPVCRSGLSDPHRAQLVKLHVDVEPHNSLEFCCLCWTFLPVKFSREREVGVELFLAVGAVSVGPIPHAHVKCDLQVVKQA